MLFYWSRVERRGPGVRLKGAQGAGPIFQSPANVKPCNRNLLQPLPTLHPLHLAPSRVPFSLCHRQPRRCPRAKARPLTSLVPRELVARNFCITPPFSRASFASPPRPKLPGSHHSCRHPALSCRDGR